MNFNLPKGRNVGLFRNNINYNIAGLFTCSELIFKLMDMLEQKFEYRLPIKYIYGSPRSRWNGGRLLLKDDKFNSIYNVEKEVISVIKRGVIPLFTFSNILITESDLQDNYCNNLLKLANKYKCEIIVANKILENYIKAEYPNINIHASVIYNCFTNTRDIYYYERLSSDYYMYVVHPDDNFQPTLLEMLPKKNAEILVNERCKYLCNIRRKHYEYISYEQIMNLDGNYNNNNFLDKCKFIPENKQISVGQRNISLSIHEMKKIVDMGYINFKIQGRTDNLYVYFFDILRYTLENNIVFPAAYTTFVCYIDEYIKRGLA